MGSFFMHSHELDTYSIQQISLENMEEMFVVTCLFAQGATSLGCHIEVAFSNGVYLLKNVSVPDSCRTWIQQQPCSATTSFSVHELSNLGNFSLSVYDLELDRASNKLFYREFQEIVEITPATSIVNNSSKSTLTTVAVTTIIQSVTPLNDSNQYSDNQQIPVVIGKQL